MASSATRCFRAERARAASEGAALAAEGDGSGKAHGGLIAAGSSAWVGEAGMERAWSLPGGGTMITPVATGGAGGQPAVIRLEIGGRALMDYVDEQLVYRPRR